MSSCGAFLVAAGSGSSGNGTTEAAVDVFVHQGDAELVAWAYLNGEPSPLGAVEGVSPRFGRAGGGFTDPVLAWQSAETITVAGTATELHRFWASTGEGVWSLTVPITSNPAGSLLAGPVTIGAGPTQPADPAESPVRWATLQPQVPSPNLAAQIEAWAAAWVADDRGDLQRIAGDSTAAPGTYVGLGGWVVAGLSIEPPVATAEDNTNDLWAQVTVTMTLASDDTIQTSVGFDLRIEDAQSNLPRIVAWGPWGSGPLLGNTRGGLL